MDGVFMKKMIISVAACALLAAAAWTGALLRDRAYLSQQLIRFHVVANSDSEEDQAVKLRVRDAVLAEFQEELAQIGDVHGAKVYLQENLRKIEAIANQTLAASGVDTKAVATVCREAFGLREYETFSLPAGMYESLRIVIGKGEGRNWWCVAFPSLCMSATTDGFAQTAVLSGMSGSLADTLAGKKDCQIRFFLLDALGNLEKIFASAE